MSENKTDFHNMKLLNNCPMYLPLNVEYRTKSWTPVITDVSAMVRRIVIPSRRPYMCKSTLTLQSRYIGAGGALGNAKQIALYVDFVCSP